MFVEINTSDKIFSILSFFSRFAFIGRMKKIILSLSVVLSLGSCSTQKNTFQNRTYHKTTAWFNALYNAEQELDKVKEEQLNEYQYNWGEILPVDPVNEIRYTKSQAPNINQISRPGQKEKFVTPTGLDAVETKAQRVIEKHSMYIDGKEENQLIGRAYLLMGKARYYKKEYFDALDALNFIKSQLPNSKYAEEAQIFITLSELKGGNFYDGREKLAEMYEQGMSKRNLQLEVAKNFGQYLIDTQKYELATEVLTHAESLSKNKTERARLNFILGQLYAKLDDRQEQSEAHFTKAYELKPGYDMEVKAQIAMAINFQKEKNDYETYKNHLESISSKGVYKKRKNELDYAIGKLAILAGNLTDAETYLKSSLKEKEISDPYIRGKAYEAYADLEFDRGNYLYATVYYDSAVTAITHEKEINRINLRNDALKKLMEKHYLVQKNDSILRIAQMSKTEQEKYFQNYIDTLKIKEERQRIEEEKQMALANSSPSVDFQLGGTIKNFNSTSSGGSKFYFYNQGLKSDGVLEFQRVWGNQSLRDNWRFSTGGTSALEKRELELTGKLEEGNPRRFDLDFYLEKIPTQPKVIQNLKIERDTTELSLGIGYYDQFSNERLAISTLEHLISTPPKNIDIKANAIYQMYRITKAENDPSMEKYKNQILTEFPNTLYAGYINNPMEDYLTPETKEALADYEAAYSLYKEGKYEDTKTKVRQAIEQYPTQTLIAKFALLNAFAVGKTESLEQFRGALEVITIAYDGTQEAKKAKELLKKLDATKNKTNAAEETKKEVDRAADVLMPTEKKESTTPQRNRTGITGPGSIDEEDTKPVVK
ncbi:Uncharacterised protein [Weeksella virosa]|uniref:TPR domain protein n=2 Tax=Weeksella virosa TaxID=1014 RepID=F0P083_WEEVC|nr:TPR domain protein [Weeksella virosa DSM 16922]VEH63900.1 Uncharacterised protein [Weeksella virosa]